HNLAADRAQERLPLAELALDRRPGRRALSDDLDLLRVGVLQLALPRLHFPPELHHLLEDERILLGHAILRIHPGEHLVEARRAEEDDERRVLAFGGVEADDAPRRLLLRAVQAPLRDREAVRVLREVVLDVAELDVREVVRLDGALEARVE